MNGRIALARWWATFVVLWCIGVVVLAFPLMYLACDAENAGPEPGSAREAYCDGVGDYLEWGEPSEWTTPLPYLLPVAILVALGSYGVWRKSRRFLRDAAAAAVTAIIAHLVVLVLLPG